MGNRICYIFPHLAELEVLKYLQVFHATDRRKVGKCIK